MFAGDLKNIFQMHGIDLLFELRKKNHKTFKFEELNVKEKNCNFVPDWFFDFFFFGGKMCFV